MKIPSLNPAGTPSTASPGLLRAPEAWYLTRKDGVIAAMMMVFEGEQPYYVRRHVGFAGSTNAETSAFGIGKKRLDGHVDRLWIMANGCVTLGDDLEPISIRLLKQGLL